MSRSFVRASSQFLELAAAPVTAVPLTLALWFNPTTAALAQNLLTIANTADTTNRFAVQLSSLGAVVAQTNSVTATTTATASNGLWQHAAAVFSAANSRAAYLNGANKVTNASSATPSGLNVTDVGCRGGSARANFFGGQLAEVGIWNAALTDTEVAQLAAGARVLSVRPSALVAYWPLFGLAAPEQDVQLGIVSATRNPIAVTGATRGTSHGPVRLWTRPARTPPDAAAPVGAAPVGVVVQANQAVKAAAYF